MRVAIELAELEAPAAGRLIARLNDEIQARYDSPVEDFVLAIDPEEVAPACGAFVLAWLGAEPIGCGAVRLLDAGTAELKRMYVVSDHRRRGVAGAILRFLEDQAVVLGARRAVLETVNDPPAAPALYRSAGYEVIPKFGPYIGSEISLCMGKALDRFRHLGRESSISWD